MRHNHPTSVLLVGIVLGACNASPDDADPFGDGSAESTGQADTTGNPATSAASETDGATDGFKFDLGIGDHPIDCGGEGGAIAFSHLWVGNPQENSVSKVDTLTVTEVGRYKVHPVPVVEYPQGGGGNPSRTSVNLNGDMVVANRGGGCLTEPKPDPDPYPLPGCGGVTKIAAEVEDCVDRNDDGMITTSTGQNDVKTWMEDECVLWHTPLTSNSNRPVAWTSGVENEDGCSWDDAKVWTAISDPDTVAGIRVLLLNGDDGTIEQDIPIDDFNGGVSGSGAYGGAVDSNNDFWFSDRSGKLGHVSFDDFSAEVIASPTIAYGIMVDNKDRIWLAYHNIERYDPATATWDTVACDGTCTTLVQDQEGWIWVTEHNEVTKRDAETMQVVDTTNAAASFVYVKGITVDVEGFIWALQPGHQGFKIDPNTLDFDTFTNVTGMYTYSDMTGFGLYNVADPSG